MVSRELQGSSGTSLRSLPTYLRHIWGKTVLGQRLFSVQHHLTPDLSHLLQCFNHLLFIEKYCSSPLEQSKYCSSPLEQPKPHCSSPLEQAKYCSSPLEQPKKHCSSPLEWAKYCSSPLEQPKYCSSPLEPAKYCSSPLEQPNYCSSPLELPKIHNVWSWWEWQIMQPLYYLYYSFPKYTFSWMIHFGDDTPASMMEINVLHG